MTPDEIKENKERQEVLRNDQKVREQERVATMLDHARSSADDDRGGRFAGVNKTVVVGLSPVVYPPLPAASPWHGSDPVGQEPPLGYPIDQMPELEPPAGSLSPVAPGPASDAPSVRQIEPRSDAGPLSSEGTTNE